MSEYKLALFLVNFKIFQKNFESGGFSGFAEMFTSIYRISDVIMIRCAHISEDVEKLTIVIVLFHI